MAAAPNPSGWLGRSCAPSREGAYPAGASLALLAALTSTALGTNLALPWQQQTGQEDKFTM